MAHFLALLDPDRDRSRRVGDAARSALGAEAGLRIGALECRDLAVIWAAHPDAPVDVSEEEGDLPSSGEEFDPELVEPLQGPGEPIWRTRPRQ